MYKSTLGVDCPGCGFQRSLILLLKGDIAGSFVMFPALLPTFITFLILITHLIFKFKNGHKYILVSFITTTITMVVSYILKFL